MTVASGLVLLDKPPGLTSFQALHILKKRLGTGRVGHTGTLDRFASGLLIVCVGSMTRLAGYLTGLDKEYEAVFSFGTRTDTLDPEGAVVQQAPIPDFNEISSVLPRFTGNIMQKPPEYSAIHVDGERAHRMVRKGRTVDIPAREVSVYSITTHGWNPPELSCTVRCSKGTYIRSLARDIGEASGSCAFTKSLRRTKNGIFSVNNAVCPDDFVPERDLVSGRECFGSIPGIGTATVGDVYGTSVLNGQPIRSCFFVQPVDSDGLWALFSEEDTLLAVAERQGNRWSYRFVTERQ